MGPYPFFRLATAWLAAGSLSTPALVAALPPPAADGYHPKISSNGDPKIGAVASEKAYCSQIGTELLQAGGNAADAAVGTTFCVGVLGMVHSGIGGGGFMLVRAPNGTYEYIDFRETAPASAYERMYVEDPLLARWGGLSVAVPGELRGLKKAHELWGTVDWSELVEPSVKLARGWKVSKELARRIDVSLQSAGVRWD